MQKMFITFGIWVLIVWKVWMIHCNSLWRRICWNWSFIDTSMLWSFIFSELRLLCWSFLKILQCWRFYWLQGKSNLNVWLNSTAGQTLEIPEILSYATQLLAEEKMDCFYLISDHCFPSYRNESIDLHFISIDWFLYDGEHWSLMG